MTDDTTAAAPDEEPKREESAPNEEPEAESPAVADAQVAPQEAAQEPTPPDEPEPAPQAQAGIEAVTEPDPQGEPESPTVPPEVAADEAAVGRMEAKGELLSPASDATPKAEPSEPVIEKVAEAQEAETEPTAESEAGDEAPESVPAEERSAEVDAEPAPAEAAPPEPEPEAKPKKSRKKAAPARAASESVAVTESADEVAPVEGEPAVATEEPQPENKKKWYAIKVQSGREDTIKAAIMRKVAIEGLEEFVGQIMIPFEEVVEKKAVRVKDKKTGEYTTQEKKVTRKRKKFHGYIFAELEYNERTLFLIRETSGVGDFLNMRGKPPVPEPMPDHEVQSMLTGERHKDPLKKVKLKLDFEKGDKVRIRDGSFANSEGEVKAITEAKDPTETPKVTVVLTFWGRPLDVELEASQVEKV